MTWLSRDIPVVGRIVDLGATVCFLLVHGIKNSNVSNIVLLDLFTTQSLLQMRNSKFISQKPSPGVQPVRTKRLLLPMPRAAGDNLSLHVHVALDAMRRGRGSINTTQTLAQVMILAKSLAGAGYGVVTSFLIECAEEAIVIAYERGRDENRWAFDDDAFAVFARLVTTFDFQLEHAPLAAHTAANTHLEQSKTGTFTAQRVAGRT